MPTSRLPIWLFLGLFALFFMTSSGGFESGDALGRYETAKSFASGHSGALAADRPLNTLVQGRNGKWFVAYGPLQALVMTPLVWATGHLALPVSKIDSINRLAYSLIFLPWLGAVTLLLIFFALRQLRFSERSSVFAVMAIAVTTPFWHYARSAQEENLVSFGYALWLWGAARLANRHANGVLAMAGGACVALATRWFSVASLIPLLLLSVGLLWRQRQSLRAASLISSAALCATTVAGLLGYNAFRFGSIWETGYGLLYRNVDTFSLTPFLPRTLALLFSPYRGLFLYAPVLVVFLLPALLRHTWPWKRDTLGQLRAAGPLALAGALALNASYFFWTAGYAWGPRFLVAPLVLFAPWFATLPSLFVDRPWLRRTGTFLMGLSFLVQFGSVVLPSSTEEMIREGAGINHLALADAWKCEWTAVCLRPGLAAAAIQNTLTKDSGLTVSFEATGQGSAWESSDFHTVFWWPFRFSFRFETFAWSVAISLFVALSLITAWLFARLYSELSCVTPYRREA